MKLCPACETAPDTAPFFRLDRVPTSLVMLQASEEVARATPTGSIELVRCSTCGLVWNRAFDPALVAYDEGYEATQAASPTFSAFQAGLARRLVAACGTPAPRVIEVGCGQGEFLVALRVAGAGPATGFDPAWRGVLPGEGIAIHAARFEGAAVSDHADLVCCLMTLEHILDAADLTRRMAAALAPQGRLAVMVPDAGRILRHGCFWDVYYEHVSYYTADSLRALLARAGLRVVAIESVYEGQYLLAGAVLDNESAHRDVSTTSGPEARFGERAAARIAGWRRRLGAGDDDGPRTVLWGGGSKAVAFLTTLGLGSEVAAVVDINPRRQGSFLPLTGHRIVSPEDLVDDPPAQVVVMNPVYRDEIAATVSGLGLAPRLLVLDDAGVDEA